MGAPKRKTKVHSSLRWMLSDTEAPAPAEFKEAVQPLPEDPAEVLAYVGDDPARAAAMLEREKGKGRKARRGLVSALEEIVEPVTRRPADPATRTEPTEPISPDPAAPPEKD